MRSFEYYTPTKVIFGKDTHTRAGELAREYGATKVLVHYGSERVRESGLLDEIFHSLEEAGLSYVSLGGVVPNPRLSKVYEGIELARREQVDFLLAVGGGSVIDSSKAIAYGIANPDEDVWNFYNRTAVPKACAPVAAVLTIAAAGSEMSDSSVITNENGWLKRGCNNDLCRCKFAILNPKLTYTLPQYQTESGCVDILMHTMERYFVNIETMEVTDGISEALMQTVIYNARILLKEPGNYNARAEVMWAGSLSHNGLMGCGTGGGDWACHQLEHELGGMFDVAHGAGLAAVWGSWARYVYEANPERFAQFATNIFGIPCDGIDFEKTALAGIEAMEDFYRSIQMPTSISELGITLTDEQIHELAFKCSFEDTRTIGVFKQLNLKDMEKIYQMAR
ncbi:MAG TPA: iron-containing alcohol dehydrogenase [Candidatus Blautia gallistercoris]|uniref:Iron-containing alcohol dehydrogenase n=1 Tax=Candidatus Blautia gallistercoris TaxID=2838490 RepID=A0A9D2B3T0_9FIRM|nr:iron-containing alcohol dehydrogenase [Candidatus Blautia gallistercoris]